MDKQMEMFEDGGLMDEGGMVDEVSGNDVPPGSTREEVRDDIPAQLSEGEFVFPADVVRYIGLENLMRMRQEAKMGLAQMEAMGQMGNSEEATMPDDLPFDMYDLEVEDDGVQDFAQGGVVQAQAGTFVPPNLGSNIGGYQPSQFAGYTPQYTPYTPPPVPTGQQLAQQYTPATQQTVPTMTQQAPTFTGFTGMAAPGAGGYDEIKTYVNAAGMQMQIPFKNGQPIYPIPEGYSLKDPTATTDTTTTGGSGAGQTVAIDSGDDSEPKPLSPYEQKIKEVQSSKEFKEVYDLFDPRTTTERVVDDIKGLYTTFSPVARSLGLRDTTSQEYKQMKDELAQGMLDVPASERQALTEEIKRFKEEGMTVPGQKIPVEDMTTPAAREKLKEEGKLTESPEDVRDVTIDTTQVTKVGKATEVIEKGISEYAKQLGISPEEVRKQMEQSSDVAENVERIGQLVDKGATVEPAKPSAAPAETKRIGTDTYGLNDDFTIRNSQSIAENRRNEGTNPYEDDDIVYTSEVYNPSTGRTETIEYNVHGIGKNSRGQTTFASGNLKTDARGKVVNAKIPGSKPSGSGDSGRDTSGSGTSSDGSSGGYDAGDTYSGASDDFTSSGDWGSGGIGAPGLAKGGLAKQMEKSGLTPKK